MVRSSFKEALIRRSELFSALSPVQWESVRKEAALLRLERHEYLFAQQDKADRFFMLASGTVKLFLRSEDGNEKVLRILSSGQTFGEALMFLEKTSYPVHAMALQESEVYAFKSSGFLRILRESPETTFRLLGLLSCRLQGQLQEIDSISLQNAPARFARYLVDQLPEQQQGEVVVTLNVPKQVVAARISVQPASFSRILRGFTKEGVIRVEGNTIHILNVAALRARVRSCL
ncbi:MAG: Crp/Fnr family transcriptional regulator [Magnetococcales bacterium]|nr:Crp/Fnr family transcriptional regulator [Magnetococcales bacterium]